MRYVGLRLCALSASMVGCFGSPDASADRTSEARAAESAPEVQADSAAARQVLGALRERRPQAAPGAATKLAPDAPDAPAAAAPLLARGAFRLQRQANHLLPLRAGEAPGARAVALALPVHADAPFHLAEPAGAAIDVRLRDASDAPAESAEGYVVYRGAGPSGATLLQRPTEDGTEDYISFDRAPAQPEVSYEVVLGARIAGLRLVANTLELLDASGDPRLRVAPPYLIGRDGERTDAELSVEGCAVDRDPAPPWDRAPVAPGAASCVLSVRWDPDAVVFPAILDPSWTSTANMSSARANPGSAVLSNGRVLVAGGINASGTAVASAELYNPTTRTWAATGSMSAVRSGHTATPMNNGRVLIAGGTNASGTAQSAALQYSPSSGTFLAAGSMASARGAGHTATLLSSGKVLIAGGSGTNGSAVAGAELYTSSLVTPGTWATTASMPIAQSGHRAAMLSNGRVLVVGSGAPSALLYNVSAGTWSATGALAVPRVQGALTLLANGQALYAGGDGTTEAATTCEVYNPSSAVWTRTGSLINPRLRPQATLLSDQRVLLTGVSVGGPSTGSTSTELYNATWGVWAPAPNAATLRAFGQFQHLLSNNRVLLAGGYSDGLVPTAAAEEFIPTTTAVSSTEYHLPFTPEPDVTNLRTMELWAAVYRPTTLAAGTRYPLLVFLHGQHQTCGHDANPRVDDSYQYTTEGRCTGAAPIVVPNHAGYAYVGQELASRGYIVVSINANRLNQPDSGPDGDQMLNLARGRLVLKHLQKLSEWSRGVAPTPASIGVSLNGKLDFSQVGLMGHSRGGESMRAAYQQYRAGGSIWPGRIVTPLTVRGIFEVGPVDNPHLHVLNADSTKWVTLLPMCDGDAPTLAGLQVFDRMMNWWLSFETTPTFKATYLVYGANHNYYNTEWQQSDSTGCIGGGPNRQMFSDGPGITGSAEQRQTGLYAMLSFFLANVGATTTPSLNQLFDPRHPTIQNPRIDRGYTPAWNFNYTTLLEDFHAETGISSYGFPNDSSGAVFVAHREMQTTEHDYTLRVGEIAWLSASQSSFYQTNFREVGGGGLDLSANQYLDLRVTRVNATSLNPTPTTDFQVRLVNGNNTLSGAANISSYLTLDGGPYGAFFPGPRHVLQTARIPLSAFSGATLSSIRGVRLTFSSTPTGQIFVTKIRATRGNVEGTLLAAGAPPAALPAPVAPSRTLAAPDAGSAGAEPIVAGSVITGNPAPVMRASTAGRVEIELASETPLDPKSQALVLQIGSAQWSRVISVSPDARRVVFSVPRAELEALAGGEPVSVRIGLRGPTRHHWQFGAFDEQALPR
jgi:Kelch motif